MNKMTGGLITLVAGAALAAWLLLPTESGESVPITDPGPGQTSLNSEPATVESPQTDSAEATDNDAEITAGAEMPRDFNCSMTPHLVQLGDGRVTEAYSCDPPEVEQPFAAYSDADLLVMSYSDAEAAKELGKRLLYQNEEGPANEMMLRAVALRPDDISPFKYLVTQTGSLRGPTREARRQVGNAYIISKTASYFDPTVSTNWLSKELVEHRFTAEDIERLDRIVESNLARMRAVQIEVFGESRIGEAL